MPVTLDFETRSAKPIKAGPHAYAMHESTSVLCMAYAIDDGPVRLWHPAFPNATPSPIGLCPYPADLDERVRGGDLIEAHNAMFERCIWTYQMVEKHGFPPVDPGQWRCSAAVAAAHAIPRKLEKACEAMDTEHKKNMDGHRLMLKMSKPRKPTKHDKSVWHEKTADFHKLWKYCMDDVAAERALSESLDPLTPDELRVWQMDQGVNWRGINIDQPMVESAIKLLDETSTTINDRMAAITGGAVLKTTTRDPFLAWVKEQGVVIMTNTQKQTLQDILKWAGVGGVQAIPDNVREAIEVWLKGNKASVKKYKRMASDVAPDGRLHDTLMYCGAGTGRWSGKGVQPQNVKRGYSKEIEVMCQAIIEMDADWLSLYSGDVLEALSLAIRGAFMASPGKTLVSADYSAIEARGTFWLAQDQDALGIFLRSDAKQGYDIYCVMASTIFGRVITPADTFERFIGKQAVLGLGYQMGFLKWIDTIHNYGSEISELQAREMFGEDYDRLVDVALSPDAHPNSVGEYWAPLIRSMRFRQKKLNQEDIHEQLFAANVVRTYRETYSSVKALWKDMEMAAVDAVNQPGRVFNCSHVKWKCTKDRQWLKLRLPSGRVIYYREPQLRKSKLPWGGTKPQVTHMAVDGPGRKWRRIPTYGGKLVENAVQGLSRDVMAEAMLRLEDHGYDLVTTVHDEVVAEVDEDTADLGDFEEVMSQVPVWAKGFPIAVEGWKGRRYRK